MQNQDIKEVFGANYKFTVKDVYEAEHIKHMSDKAAGADGVQPEHVLFAYSSVTSHLHSYSMLFCVINICPVTSDKALL